MLYTIVASSLLTSACILLFFIAMQKRKYMKNKKHEEKALGSVASVISERLYELQPKSKWRWVCYPAGFSVNGGIARIEVLCPDNLKMYVDVCLSAKGYMALHEAGAVELTGTSTQADSPEAEEEPAIMPAIRKSIKPHDEDSVGAWYNIVFINALITIIGDLNAKGEACVYVNANGETYVEANGNIRTVYDFGELPGIELWDYIIEKLSEDGLFAEAQSRKIFISWA